MGKRLSSIIAEALLLAGGPPQLPQSLAHPGMKHQKHGRGQKGKPPPHGMQQRKAKGPGMLFWFQYNQPFGPCPTLIFMGIGTGGGFSLSICSSKGAPFKSFCTLATQVFAWAVTRAETGCPPRG